MDQMQPHTRKLFLLLLIVLAVSLLVSPITAEQADMYGCWLPWARATQGYRPWNAYSLPTCNYPPFMLYVLTAVEAVIRLTHRSPWGPVAVALVKLPSILSCAAGVILCAYGLVGVLGEKYARAAGVLYALCIPLWFNAAVWGQFDALLSLAMLATVIALVNDRPLLSGACLGWALSIKLQAIVLVPVVAVWVFRRLGFTRLVSTGAVSAIVLTAFIAPMVAGGQGRAVRLAYTGAVDYFPYLSNDAFNPWALLKQYYIHVRHLPQARITRDSIQLLGPISAKQLGLIAFGAYTLFLMIGLYRRPTPNVAAMASGLMAFVFFLLLTQMHERYSIPAAALLAICIGFNGSRVYLCVMIPCLINQLKSFISEHYGYHASIGPSMQRWFDLITILVSFANLLVLAYVTWLYSRQTSSKLTQQPHSA